MNTYHLGSTLAPTAKYDSRFSTAVGRWFLNASNSLRLMYPNEVPAENQIHGGAFAGDPNGVIGYEGVRKTFNGTSHYAMGDPTIYGWGKTNYGLYGSVHVGMFGALIEPTNVEQILRIDLNALDSFKDEGTYPQYLYYNPYPVEKTVQMKLDTPSVLFDTVTNRMISGNVSGTVSISIPAQSSVNVVVLPKDSNVIRAGEEYRVGNRVIAKESAAISILSPDRQKATVSGQVEFQLSVDSREEVESVVLTANGVEVASAKGKTDALTADTTKLANGSTLFQATVRTVGGLTDTSSIKLNSL